MFHIQRRLSFAQAIPIVGPLIFSPMKAMVSTAQIIAGIAGSIIFSLGFCLTESPASREGLKNSGIHVMMRLTSLSYSAVNFFSYGIIGFTMEYIFLPVMVPIR